MTTEHTELIGIQLRMSEAESIISVLMLIHKQAEPIQLNVTLLVVAKRLREAAKATRRLAEAA